MLSRHRRQQFGPPSATTGAPTQPRAACIPPRRRSLIGACRRSRCRPAEPRPLEQERPRQRRPKRFPRPSRPCPDSLTPRSPGSMSAFSTSYLTPRISGRAAARSFEYAFRRQVVPAPHQPWAAPWPLHAVVRWRNGRAPTRGRGPRRRRGRRQASGVRHPLRLARSRSSMTAAVASTKRPEEGMASHLRDSFAAPVLPRPGARNPAHIQKVA